MLPRFRSPGFENHLKHWSDLKSASQRLSWHHESPSGQRRLLHLTFTLRKAASLIRVISARDMHRKERTIYEQAD